MDIKRRNGAIDFWKFIFAIIIVLFHSKDLTTSGNNIFGGGSIGVDFFFVVSGFLMAGSALRPTGLSIEEDTRHFIWKKIKGLIPEIYIAWIIAFIVEHSVDSPTSSDIVKDALSSIWELLFLNFSGLKGYRANHVTWYISAMLLSMLVLYPILKKNRKLFMNLIAPLVSLLILGWMYQDLDNLRGVAKWLGFVFNGQLRAISEVSLGCICYGICEHIKNKEYSVFGKCILALVEVGGFLSVIIYSYSNEGSKADFILLLLLAISVTITFSRKSVISSLFDNGVSLWLGKFSLCLYLSHGYWTHVLLKFYPDKTYYSLLVLYFGIVIINALFLMYFSAAIRESSPQINTFFKRLIFIEKKASQD